MKARMGIRLMVVVMGFLMLALNFHTVSAQDIWPMFRYDLKRSGRSPYTGPHCACIDCVVYNTAAVKSSPAIAGDGTIYYGTEDGWLEAVQRNCHRKWRYYTGGTIWASPAIDPTDGTIYIGTRREDTGYCSGAMYAINPNGTLKWRYPVIGYIDDIESSVAVTDSVLYFGTACMSPRAGAMYSLYRNGTLKCVFNNAADGWITASPAVKNDGKVAFGDFDNPRGKFNVMNPDATCSIFCSTPVPGGPGEIDIWSTTALDELEGQAYFGGSTGHSNSDLWAFDFNCNFVWSYTTGGHVPGSPALALDGTIYVGSYDDSLYAVNPDGSRKWAYGTDGDIWASPAVDADGTIYVGNMAGTFYAINPDGTLKWSRTVGGSFMSSPAIGPGFLVVGNNSGLMFIFAPHGSFAVELASLTAAGYDDRVEIEWSTVTEIDNAGFNVHRGTSEDGRYVQVNEEMIHARGGELEGASYSFTDRDVEEGVTYYYLLEDINLEGNGTMQGPVSVAAGSRGNDATPAVFSLAQNHPNPFNPVTEIKYNLPVNCHVMIEVYNVLGQRVVTLVNEYQNSGSKVVQWNGRDGKGLDVVSGIYFYRLHAGDFTDMKKMVLLR